MPPSKTPKKKETAAEKKARLDKKKSEVVVSTRTVVIFKGSNYDSDGDSYWDYEAEYTDGKDSVKITAPCGEERYFKVAGLKALLEAL